MFVLLRAVLLNTFLSIQAQDFIEDKKKDLAEYLGKDS